MKTIWNMRTFKELSLNELYDILQLREEVFVVEQKCAYQEIDGQDKTALHLLGTQNGSLVAYGRILPQHANGMPHVGRVVVREAFRSNGIASELMKKTIETITQQYGSARSALAAQSHLEQFYARFGYVRKSEDYDWDGIPHVDMEREN